MLVEQSAVSVAAVLPAAVGVDHEFRGGQLREKGPPQGRGDQFFRHRGPHVPAHDVFGGPVLKGAQVGPCAMCYWPGAGQGTYVGAPHLIGPGGLGLVQQPFGAQRSPCVESLVRGVNALDYCKARGLCSGGYLRRARKPLFT